MTARQAAGMSPMEVGPRLGAREEAPVKEMPFVPMVPAGVTPRMLNDMLVEALGKAIEAREAKAFEQKARVPNSKQRGHFRVVGIPAYMLPETLIVQDGVVIVAAQDQCDGVEYYGYCADFDEVDPGDITPAYAVAIHHENGVPVRRTFIRETT